MMRGRCETEVGENEGIVTVQTCLRCELSLSAVDFNITIIILI